MFYICAFLPVLLNRILVHCFIRKLLYTKTVAGTDVGYCGNFFEKFIPLPVLQLLVTIYYLPGEEKIFPAPLLPVLMDWFIFHCF